MVSDLGFLPGFEYQPLRIITADPDTRDSARDCKESRQNRLFWSFWGQLGLDRSGSDPILVTINAKA